MPDLGDIGVAEYMSIGVMGKERYSSTPLLQILSDNEPVLPDGLDSFWIQKKVNTYLYQNFLNFHNYFLGFYIGTLKECA